MLYHMTVPTKCALCGVKATQLCGGCKNVVYCGRDHQIEHWRQGHKQQCKCYKVVSNEQLGRHMCATRDIKAGEIIMREKPLLVGPKVASMPLCLGCHCHLLSPVPPAKNYYKCSKCTWPLCGEACESAPQHAYECKLMADSRFQSKINFGPEPIKKESAYCVIMLLRCMQLKSTNPIAYEEFYKLEDHLEERINTPLYQVLRANLVTFCKTILGLDDWSELEILRLAAILDTNTFEVRQLAERRKVRALFPGAAMISHDCVPNARHTFDADMNIVFLAKHKIAKGDTISISYTQLLRSTLQRRLHLRQAKCFDCTCARCTDPTELGTFAGAVLCPKCKVGKIISTNPLDNAAVWKCQLCNYKKTASAFITQDAVWQQEIESINKSTPQALEDFIDRHRNELHENNTHILQIKYALTQLYGGAAGYSISELTDNDLKRKVDLCEELLQLADLLDAGWSIFRGNLLLDLEDALVEQAVRIAAEQAESQAKLKRAEQLLQEVEYIMKLEPEMIVVLQERRGILETQLKCFTSK